MLRPINLKPLCDAITSAAIHTAPVFELDLHFGPNYTSGKFYVCISNGCNAIVLTTFCRLSETNKLCQNICSHLCCGPHYKTCPESLFGLLTHTHRQTLTR